MSQGQSLYRRGERGKSRSTSVRAKVMGRGKKRGSRSLIGQRLTWARGVLSANRTIDRARSDC
jgi:hypothetical protein